MTRTIRDIKQQIKMAETVINSPQVPPKMLVYQQKLLIRLEQELEKKKRDSD